MSKHRRGSPWRSYWYENPWNLSKWENEHIFSYSKLWMSVTANLGQRQERSGLYSTEQGSPAAQGTSKIKHFLNNWEISRGAISKFIPAKEWGPFSSSLKKVTATRVSEDRNNSCQLANRKIATGSKDRGDKKINTWVLFSTTGARKRVGVPWNTCTSTCPKHTNIWDLETRNENYLNHSLFIDHFQHSSYSLHFIIIKCLLF